MIIHFSNENPSTLCVDINEFAKTRNVFATQTHLEVRGDMQVIHHAYVFYNGPSQ